MKIMNSMPATAIDGLDRFSDGKGGPVAKQIYISKLTKRFRVVLEESWQGELASSPAITQRGKLSILSS